MTPNQNAEGQADADGCDWSWRCGDCGCRTYARIDERQPDGSYGPGDGRRCVSCKAVTGIAKPQPLAKADELLTEEDHAVIRRCVERGPRLFVRGQHEGYYIHSDVTDLIDIVGRLNGAAASQASEIARLKAREAALMEGLRESEAVMDRVLNHALIRLTGDVEPRLIKAREEARTLTQGEGE